MFGGGDHARCGWPVSALGAIGPRMALVKYDRRAWPSMKWSLDDIPDQTGKTVVITGANSGIGYYAALELAKRGADVVLACRRLDAAEEAAARINKVARGRARGELLDLGDLESVAAFVARAPKTIAVLINNAGIMMVPEALTPQGYESQWGVNVVGHAALTHGLLDRITERVVTIASLAHRSGDIDPASFTGADYNPWKAYAQSKLGDLIFALRLERHLRESGSNVISVAAHPGVSLTRLAKDMPWYLKALMLPYVPFLQTAARGALPTLYAATADVEGGTYWGPRGRKERRGRPHKAHIAGRALKPANQETVWAAVWPDAR